jgi:hypothetical protein
MVAIFFKQLVSKGGSSIKEGKYPYIDATTHVQIFALEHSFTRDMRKRNLHLWEPEEC